MNFIIFLFYLFFFFFFLGGGGGVQKNFFGGYEDFVDIFRSTQIEVYLGVISMHLCFFLKVKVRYLNGGYFGGW